MWWYSRISKFSKNFTYKNHPSLNQKACFSSLVGFKSPFSSKHGYMTNHYPNSFCLVKHYHNSGVTGLHKTSPKLKFVTGKKNFLLFPLLIAGGVTSVFVYEYSEKIPYTNRRHIVIPPPSWDKIAGDKCFERDRWRWSILSEEHPDSVRVKMIGEKIIEALESDVKAMKNQNVRVDQLVGFEWKFLVVENSHFDVFSLAGGKIFLSTGVFKTLESDAQIATAIAHEVGHSVARHTANKYNMHMLKFNARVLFGMELKWKRNNHIPHCVSKWIRIHLFPYPKFRRQECEADEIGLLIMASAGYDPQVAPKMYEIIDNINQVSQESELYHKHPSGRKRAKKLARGKVMKEASSRYSKVMETRKMNDLKDR